MRLASICKVLLLVTLILSFGVQVVHAQQEVIVWFDPLTSQVYAGDTATVRLIVDAQVPVGGFDLIFEYDPNVVILDGWAYGSFPSKLSAIKNEATPGHLWLVAVQLGVPPVSGAGVLLEFTLRGITPGTSALTITQAKFADASGNQYGAGVTNGAITVMADPLPTATMRLEPTATLTLVPTLAPTATPQPPTQAPTATRTSTPIVQATNTPQPPTATRTSIPSVQPKNAQQAQTTATRMANAVGTSQAIATPHPALQQTALTSMPAAEIDAAATQTLEAHLVWTTLEAMGTASATYPIATPLQATVTLETTPMADQENSGLNLTTAIIVFDLIVLAFIVFLLWKRRRKNLEGKS